MADLLMANGWVAPEPLMVYLREALPSDYVIVADPTIHRQLFDAVIVGPQGLFVLHTKDWVGEICVTRGGGWWAQLESGEEIRYPNPAKEARRTRDALLLFLRDEFPTLQPVVHDSVVFTKPDVKLPKYGDAEPPAMTMETAADSITSTKIPTGGALLDEDVREALALALRDQRLTVSQRASEPFIFRAGGIFGSGKKAWTIRAVVAHIDRHPEEGIYHLRNGSLARWFSRQGAENLAQLAQDVMRQRETDPRIPLEAFLLGTGLVPRPRLTVQPALVNLGYILTGQSGTHPLRVGRDRGRGYLFGTIHTNDPWLRVEPSTFSGRLLEASVRVDTDEISISQTPYQAEIEIESSASDKPISVPVRFRIMGMPSPLNRYLIRPVLGLVTAGILGVSIGWLLGLSGVQPSTRIMQIASPPLAPATVWAILIGTFWATLGMVRGLSQHLAWPIIYATGRWLARTLIWGVALSLLALAIFLSWQQLNSNLGINNPGISPTSVVLFALALAIIPASIGETKSARSIGDTGNASARRSILRPVLFVIIGIALGFVLMAGGRTIGPAWQQVDASNTTASVEQWIGDRWSGLGTSVNNIIDGVYLRYYDRRAPVEPTPEASRTPAPTNEGL